MTSAAHSLHLIDAVDLYAALKHLKCHAILISN